MSASLVNVKEHFSHLMLNHPAVNRPVRTRTRGGVGSGGEKPPLTRLGVKLMLHLLLIIVIATCWMCFNEYINRRAKKREKDEKTI